jgi:hypothetical protein
VIGGFLYFGMGLMLAAGRKEGPGLAPKPGQGSSSFLKKRTKKLLLCSMQAVFRPNEQRAKVFCFFFSKKKYFLPLPMCELHEGARKV